VSSTVLLAPKRARKTERGRLEDFATMPFTGKTRLALATLWPKERRAKAILIILFAAASAAGAAISSAALCYVLPRLARRYMREKQELQRQRSQRARTISKGSQQCMLPPKHASSSSNSLKDNVPKRVSWDPQDSPNQDVQRQTSQPSSRPTSQRQLEPAPDDELFQDSARPSDTMGPTDSMMTATETDDGVYELSPAVRVLRPMRHCKTMTWQAERSHPTSVMREAIVLVMVGLPARGKSFISNSLVRYLRMSRISVKSFNAGNLRRDTGNAGAKADYFSASNTEAKEERERLAMACTDHLLEWIYEQPEDTSCVAILDATNTTRERREKVLERCREAAALERPGVAPLPLRVVFIESICDDPTILEGNYKMKLKNDDYKNRTDTDEALEDFKKRVHAYVEQYHPLEDVEVSKEEDDIATGVVRIFNGGQKMHFIKTGCSLVMLNITTFLSCFHLSPRRIFLVPEKGTDVKRLAALLQKAEAEDPDGRPVDLICRAGKHAVRLARGVENILEKLHEERDKPSSCASDLCKEGLRQPRATLSLRKLEPRSARKDINADASGKPQSRGWKSVIQSITRELPDETFFDLVERLQEVIFTIERLPRSLVVLIPAEDVMRILLAHFMGCPEDEDAETMSLPKGPVIELHRDHKGFALTELDLPPPIDVPEVDGE